MRYAHSGFFAAWLVVALGAAPLTGVYAQVASEAENKTAADE